MREGTYYLQLNRNENKTRTRIFCQSKTTVLQKFVETVILRTVYLTLLVKIKNQKDNGIYHNLFVCLKTNG